jgi:plasmid stability protein
MAQALIRNIDPRALAKLKTKAKLKGKSLEQVLRETIEAAAPLTPEEKVALSRRVRAAMPIMKDFDVRAAIRHGRDDEFDE